MQPKYYFNDTGVLSIKSNNIKIGILAENAVYLQLRRLSIYKEYSQIYYAFIEDQEIDFYFKDHKSYYEVKYKNDFDVNDYLKYQSISEKVTFLVNTNERRFYDVLPIQVQKNICDFLLQDPIENVAN
ncbi:MAG: hypothetical protein WCJ58_00630 [bacterium]